MLLCLFYLLVNLIHGEGDNKTETTVKSKILQNIIQLDPKIVGGTNANYGDNPAQVSIQLITGQHICGGSLINMKHILTAAHCVVAKGGVYKPSALRIMGNDLYIMTPSATRQIRYPSHIWANIFYRLKNIMNDIGLIRVENPFIATENFYSLPRSYKTPNARSFCTIYGWGKTKNMGRASNSLQKATIAIWSSDQCKKKYQKLIQEYMICANSHMKDSCQGDSGGGLICNNKISGIVSFGKECGVTSYPGVYTDVSYFNRWIDECLVYNGTHEAIEQPVFIDPETDDWIPYVIMSGIFVKLFFISYCIRRLIVSRRPMFQ